MCQNRRKDIFHIVRVRASAARAAEACEGSMGDWRRAETVGGQNDSAEQGTRGIRAAAVSAESTRITLTELQ